MKAMQADVDDGRRADLANAWREEAAESKSNPASEETTLLLKLK